MVKRTTQTRTRKIWLLHLGRGLIGVLHRLLDVDDPVQVAHVGVSAQQAPAVGQGHLAAALGRGLGGDDLEDLVAHARVGLEDLLGARVRDEEAVALVHHGRGCFPVAGNSMRQHRGERR